MDNLELKKELPIDDVEADIDAEKGRARLWIAVVRMEGERLDVIEKGRLEDLREALNDGHIVSIESIYRGFRKEFKVETKVVRKLGIL